LQGPHGHRPRDPKPNSGSGGAGCAPAETRRRSSGTVHVRTFRQTRDGGTAKNGCGSPPHAPGSTRFTGFAAHRFPGPATSRHGRPVGGQPRISPRPGAVGRVAQCLLSVSAAELPATAPSTLAFSPITTDKTSTDKTGAGGQSARRLWPLPVSPGTTRRGGATSGYKLPRRQLRPDLRGPPRGGPPFDRCRVVGAPQVQGLQIWSRPAVANTAPFSTHLFAEARGGAWAPRSLGCSAWKAGRGTEYGPKRASPAWFTPEKGRDLQRSAGREALLHLNHDLGYPRRQFDRLSRSRALHPGGRPWQRPEGRRHRGPPAHERRLRLPGGRRNPVRFGQAEFVMSGRLPHGAARTHHRWGAGWRFSGAQGREFLLQP